ncbi:hypothetical protein FRC17_011130 [Serendipita sp. 399]|nr:hypothetical protein FRC17_011130 [Serendipita sp. 399]
MTGSLDNEFHNTRDPKLPLLYLTGDKNRETIPKRLSEVALECHKMQVYETSPAPDLSEKLKEVSTAVIVNTNEGGDTIPPWLVLFSPSTAEAVIGVLSESVVQFSETKQVGNESSILSSFQIASIGPTTRKYLADNSHRVAASAPKPDAESLAQAILDQVISDQ